MKNRFMLAPLTNEQSHTDGTLSDDECKSGLLTHGGGQGGHAPGPLRASQLHGIPTHALLNSHGIQWKLPTFGPPWLSGTELSP